MITPNAHVDVGIGPEISQSIKDIYVAAGVRPTSSIALYSLIHLIIGSNPMGRSQCYAYIEEWQNCDSGQCNPICKTKHSCVERLDSSHL